MDDREKLMGLAERLTDAQREAINAQHWSARARAGLVRLSIVKWSSGPHGKPIIKFTQLGLTVRAALSTEDTRDD